MAGFIYLTFATILPRRKLTILIVSIAISNLIFVFAVNQPFFLIIALFMLLGGFFNSICNVILVSTVQAAAPREMRGKVMAFMSMTSQGLTPFAMALGGVLAAFIPVRVIISVSFLLTVVFTIPFFFIKSFQEFISMDYENDKQEDAIESELTT